MATTQHQPWPGMVNFNAKAIDIEQVKLLDKPGRESLLTLMHSYLASLEEERQMAHQMVNLMQRSQDLSDPERGLMAGAVIQKLADNQLKLVQEIGKAMKLLAEVKTQWEMIDRSMEMTQESPADMFARIAEEAGIEADGFDINDLPDDLK